MKQIIYTLLIASLFFIQTGLHAQKISNRTRPTLAIVIVVDGLDINQINNYYYNFQENGLKKIMSGVYNKDADCMYLSQGTATDFAAIFTGTVPFYNGIIGDQYYNPIEDKEISIVNDGRYDGINTWLNVSPKMLQCTTIGDALKQANPNSKVYAVAINPEEAIMMAGFSANGATWIDNQTAKFATSDFYNNGLPIEAAQMNTQDAINVNSNKLWQPLYAPSNYFFTAITKRKLLEAEPIFYKRNNNISTTLQMSAFKNTPFVNDVICDLASKILVNQQLGKDDAPDLLAIELQADSPFKGTNSLEMEDLYRRLDINIEHLLNEIDEVNGLKNTIIVLTTNHSEPHSTNYYQNENKIQAGVFSSKRAMALLNTYLMAIYGQGLWISGYYAGNITLNHSLIEQKKIDIEKMENEVAKFITQLSGVHMAYTRSQLSALPQNRIENRSKIKNTYFDKISGDVVITLLPGWIETDKNNKTIGVTSIINPKVPIFFYGNNLKLKENNMLKIEDIAPTICHLLDVPAPNGCIGSIIQLQ